MTRAEVLSSPYGEFLDLLACDAIHKGQAKQKKPKRKMTFDEFIALR